MIERIVCDYSGRCNFSEVVPYPSGEFMSQLVPTDRCRYCGRDREGELPVTEVELKEEVTV